MSPKVTFSDAKPARVAADMLVVPVRDKKIVSALPGRVQDDLKTHMRARDWKAGAGDTLVLLTVAGVVQPLVVLVGLSGDAQTNFLRRGVAKALAETRSHGVTHVVVDGHGLEDPADLLGAAFEGAAISDYRFTDYSKAAADLQKRSALKKVTLLSAPADRSAVRRVVQSAQAVLPGITLTRDLVNRPANDMSPSELVASAKEIAAGSDRVSLKTFNRAQAKRANFNAFLAVGQGSDTEPYVIHLTYEPQGRTEHTKKVFLIGKGITFDSGGLNIKPTGYMETMKVDMAGAATVLGLFSVLAELAPDVEVHGLIGACENMVSGSSYRPGDVIRARNGKTIEIGNTDAEGRVTMADMLSYAAEQSPDAIVDLATLTGAAVVGLGENVAALFSSNDALRDSLLVASETTGEALASLPMPAEYMQLLKSPIADLNNAAATRWGGAITAALFLREFTNSVPWAHIDIAGPAHHDSVTYPPYYQKGATGFGVRLLADFLASYTEASTS